MSYVQKNEYVYFEYVIPHLLQLVQVKVSIGNTFECYKGVVKNT